MSYIFAPFCYFLFGVIFISDRSFSSLACSKFSDFGETEKINVPAGKANQYNEWIKVSFYRNCDTASMGT